MRNSRKRAGKHLKVLVSEGIGFCSGVRRAIKVALAAAGRSRNDVFTLGPLIHNPQVVEKLKQVGVRPIARLGKTGGTLVIRSHGASPEVISRAVARGYKVIDATCPFVRKAQSQVRRLHKMGYQVLIVGERAHPEVRALRNHIDGRSLVTESVERVKRLKFANRVGIIAQTTVPVDLFAAVVGEVVKRAREVLVFNTICVETARRQERARRLASQVDVLLVVGGRNSANTSRLKNLCRTICRRTHHIETADEIDGRWFKQGETVGIVAGASTPRWLVDEVVEKLNRL